MRKEVREIKTLIADSFGITVEQMDSRRRKAEFVVPRHLAMFLVRKHLKLSFPVIGEHFGNRDHTTIMHAVKHAEKILTGLKDWKS